jgi:hypothetical protein
MEVNCYHCGAAISPELTKQRSAVCPQCSRDLRVCLNCKFYSPGDHWDCRENISELVKDKDRSNFCDWFSPNTKKRDGQGGAEKDKSAKKAFDDLFG